MNKIKFYVLGSLLLLLSSCENFLDRQPKSELSIDTYWQTETDLKTWNAGMYHGLQTALREGWFVWGEVRGGTFAPCGTAWDANLLYNGLTSTSGSSSWSSLYATIYRANAAIKHIPESPVSATVSNPYLAQAYTMRALMYFYAIRVWGDVPMITEPMENVSTQERYYGRTDIMEIKKLMLDDLETAIELFGPISDLSAADKYYLNRGSAMALKTDILMWYKDYDEALRTADEVLNDYGYKLVQGESYKTQFVDPETSPEMIFNLFWDYVEDGGGFGYAQFLASGNYTIRYHPTEEYFNELISRKYEGDSRITLVLDTVDISNTLAGFDISSINDETYQNFMNGDYGNPANFQVRCPKFITYSATADEGLPGYEYPATAEDNTRMCLYRLVDILLLKAEALTLCSTPDYQAAIDIVNDVRRRAGWTREATIAEYSTKDAIINLILDERTIELWGEGKHWFDLVRNNKVKEYLDEYMRNADPDYAVEEGFVIGTDVPENPIGGYGRILWPLNQDVFRKNPNMSGHQNPPYTE